MHLGRLLRPKPHVACLSVSAIVLTILTTPTEASQVVSENDGSSNRWNAVERWYCDVESEVDYFDGTSPADRPRFIHRRVALDSIGALYYRLGHQFSAGSEQWLRDPNGLELVLSDSTLTTLSRFNRQYSVRKLSVDSPVPDPVDRDSIFSVVPVWPLIAPRAPRQRGGSIVFVLASALSDDGYRIVEAEPSIVNGTSCYQAASDDGCDHVWVSEEHSLCIVRREFRDARSRLLTQRLVAEKIEEVSPALWLPTQFVTTTYGGVTGSGEPVATRVSRSRIIDWRINDEVPTEVFEPQIPPGSILRISEGEFRQVGDGGLEHLEEIVGFFRDVMRLPTSPASGRTWMTAFWQFLFGFTGGAAIGFSLRVPWRSLRLPGFPTRVKCCRGQPLAGPGPQGLS